MSSLEKAWQETIEELDSRMSDLLPNGDGGLEDRLYDAMRYSALAGGKKIRPFLTVISSGLFGVSRESSLQTAAALEFIHVYSLIHDDLPAMDNDDFRRGKPSCHKQFDEATAILAGDALLTLAFEILADSSTHQDPSVCCELIRSAAKAAGSHGMVAGQMIDIQAELQNLDVVQITRLQRLKTGELFAVSCEAGAVLGKAPRNLRNALRGYANHLGLAFQITDDLLDAEGSIDQVGKMVRKDADAGKATLIKIIGIDKARHQAKMLANQAIMHLEVFDERADLLRQLAKYVIGRKR